MFINLLTVNFFPFSSKSNSLILLYIYIYLYIYLYISTYEFLNGNVRPNFKDNFKINEQNLRARKGNILFQILNVESKIAEN